MSIGYACIAIGVRGTDQKSCIMKNADEKRLIELIGQNLQALENIVDYNIQNNIKLFRISSDIIPFGSSCVNTLEWWHLFESIFQRIGNKAKHSNMRMSMHPGQYTVLNSPNEEVVKRAVLDLEYHARVLDLMGLDSTNKIILHIGGVYGNKKEAIERFVKNYHNLSDSVKKRLVIENDDKSYDISDVFMIGKMLKIPVVFDNLHNLINPSRIENSAIVKDEVFWIQECSSTWGKYDGPQKIHYSQQAISKKAGSHSNTIHVNEFITFFHKIDHDKIDIMLEVKDKNLSTVKCMNCISTNKKIDVLETEWSRYKYKVLECSQVNYNQIRILLKDKKNYPAVEFYQLIEEALDHDINLGGAVNAAQHIWGYFKDKATDIEKEKFLKNIEQLDEEKVSMNPIKNMLWRLTVKYQEEYLLNSYYFYIS